MNRGGELAYAYGNLILNMWKDYNIEEKSTIPSLRHATSPRDFKNTVGKFNDVFDGFAQQDAQGF